ncbi:hypothetical protein EDD21DRAFT_379697 [Dissophora ornata]|nr:hypothetical protein EDD21DRAFT_379697 [Dissophora ornata]
MKSFEHFANEKKHQTDDFEKLFARYSSHVGRQKAAGDQDATAYTLDRKQHKLQYDNLQISRTKEQTDAAAGKIVRKGIARHARKTLKAYDESETDESGNDESESEEKQEAHHAKRGRQDTHNDTKSPAPLPPTPTETKATERRYSTEEPWHALTCSLMEVINGQKDVSFPEPPPDMLHSHSLLFDHAVSSLKRYQDQGPKQKDKDIVLIKDAQVAMSCCLNVMSDRACEHFENQDEDGLLDAARTLSVIKGFELHECSDITMRYSTFLAENSVEDLKKKLSIDIGALNQKYANEELPTSAKSEEKVLEILKQLCQFIIRPPFGKASPSENDCLQVWVSIFSVMVEDKVTLHTGEKALEASKIMRQHQVSEYNDASESARKVDCLFLYEGLELSNIEFKKPGTSNRDLAIQNRKNVRLGRCIQEAHNSLGMQEPSVMMADVAGFVGVFYQVKKMGDIAIAGKTTSTTVTLPQDAGSFDKFLEDGSLAIMWNFISHLEKQGQKVLRAKQRFDAMSRSVNFVQSVSRSSNALKPAVEKKFENNVTLSPSKKRVWNGVIRIQTSLEPQDSDRPSSPIEEMLKRRHH